MTAPRVDIRPVLQAKEKLNAVPWWRFIKRQELAREYKQVLLAAAYSDIIEKAKKPTVTTVYVLSVEHEQDAHPTIEVHDGRVKGVWIDPDEEEE